jgi:HD-GYP domain-containing protein (c-di-GMP phosphodiesterase class II)
MQWSSLHSGDPAEAGDVTPDSMRRRFVEALRRAEIIALVNAAASTDELAHELAEELSEAFEAEVVFVIESARAGDWRILAELGTTDLETDGIARWGPALEALAGGRAVEADGEDLLDMGGRSGLLAAEPMGGGRHLLVGVVRLYPLPFLHSERALLEAVMTSAGHALERLWAQQERERLIAELRETMIGTATALANTLEARDDYTGGHARQIADLAVVLGRRLGINGERLEDLRFGAIFHDIGKIAVPDEILRKPEPLTPDEARLMEQHTIVGAEILAPIPSLANARELVLRSHERWDGQGYPDGLASDQIPLGARVIAVVDAWDAMVSDRPYRDALTLDIARAELEAGAGSQFDPNVVRAFLALTRSAAPR